MQRDAMKGLDVWGAVLFAPAMVGLTYAISTSAKNGLLSPITLGLAGSSLALLAIWVRHELRHPDPLIQVRLLANREIALCNLTMAFAGISVFQLSQFITVLAQQPTWTGVGLGLTATAAGFLRLPNSLAASVGGAMTGPLSTRFNSRIASLIGAVLMTIGFMLLIPFHTSIPQILMCIVVIGSGVTLNYSATAATIVQVAPGGRASEAAGMMSVVRGTCIAIGSQLIVLSLNIDTVQEVAGGPKYGTGEAFQFTFIWITICSLCCVLLTLALLRPPKVKPVAASALPVEAGE